MLNGAIIFSFGVKIHEIEGFDTFVIAILNRDDFKREDSMRSRNVMCIDSSGKLLWQIPELRSYDTNSPYVGLYKEDNNINLVKLDGTTAVVEAKTGKVLITPMEWMKGRKLW